MVLARVSPALTISCLNFLLPFRCSGENRLRTGVRGRSDDGGGAPRAAPRVPFVSSLSLSLSLARAHTPSRRPSLAGVSVCPHFCVRRGGITSPPCIHLPLTVAPVRLQNEAARHDVEWLRHGRRRHGNVALFFGLRSVPLIQRAPSSLAPTAGCGQLRGGGFQRVGLVRDTRLRHLRACPCRSAHPLATHTHTYTHTHTHTHTLATQCCSAGAFSRGNFVLITGRDYFVLIRHGLRVAPSAPVRAPKFSERLGMMIANKAHHDQYLALEEEGGGRGGPLFAIGRRSG